MTRADSLTGQVIAVISRRTPAFQPRAGEPVTFPGYLHRASSQHGGLSALPPRSPETTAGYPATPPDVDIIEFPPPMWRAAPEPATRPVPAMLPAPTLARPRRSLALAFGITAVVAAAATATAALLAARPHPRPVTPVPISRVASPAPRPSERQAAAALASLLAQSAAARSAVVAAVSDVNSCGPSLAADQQTFLQAAASRQQLLSALSKLPGRSVLPAAMVTDLISAWHATYQADKDYAAWAADESTHGCTPNDSADPNFRASTGPDDQATVAKKAFTSKWNTIARRYGLSTYEWSEL